MKNLVIVLASGVVAGLATYAALDWMNLLTMVVGDLVGMRIATVVGSLAGVGFGSAALALAFAAAFQRADQKRWRELEGRIARLEALGSSPKPAPERIGA